MSLTPEQKAYRAAALLADEVLIEVLDQLKAEKTAIFEGRAASQADVEQARHMTWGFNEITVRLQSLVDDQKVRAHRSAKAGPA